MNDVYATRRDEFAAVTTRVGAIGEVFREKRSDACLGGQRV